MKPALSPSKQLAGWLLAAITMTSLPATAGAEGLRSAEAATQAGLEIVRSAARGEVEEALRQSQSLGRPDNVWLSAALERSRVSIAGLARDPAGSASTQLTDITQFGGCINRVYVLRSASGKQFWNLKFRRTARGWFLDDLVIRS